MGFIKAFRGSVGGTLANQWKDFYVPRQDLPQSALIIQAVPNGVNAGRGSNVKNSDNIISNGSKIVVPEGMALITMQDGKITGCVMEAGGFIYQNDDVYSKSFFAGDGILASTVKQSWEIFKFGGIPGSQQTAFYVNLKEIPNNLFGTQGDGIFFDDMFLNTQVQCRVRGSYTFKIEDPILFISKFVPQTYLQPNAPILDVSDPDNDLGMQIFNEIVGTLSAAFSAYSNSSGGRIANIQRDSIGFAKSMAQAIEDAYQWKSDRGLVLCKTAIVSIEYDEDTQKLLSDVKKADALSGHRGASFMQQSIARGMQAMGESGNGGADLAFMGVGLNAAQGMMGAFGNMQTPQQPQPKSEPSAVEKLKELKEMLDAGLITQNDYDKAKAQILGI